MSADNLTAGSTHEQTTLGGGCFWCVEAVFEQLRGVSAVESGYCGGGVTAPTYEQVHGSDRTCRSRAGHVRSECDLVQ